MYINDWNEFRAAAEHLFLRNPDKSRYVLKYHHKKGKLVLKVTDDVKCLKFRTDQQQDVRLLHEIHALFLRHMTTKKLDTASDMGESASGKMK